MANHRNDWDWGFAGIFDAGFGHREFNSQWKDWTNWAGSRRRSQMFESGEVKFILLRLIQESPRHGYEVIKALAEKTWNCYTPSAGTIYPTLQLLEDQGYIRAVETAGKKVYHITRDGERFLEEHRAKLDEILERVRDTVRDFAGGAMGDLNGTFARLAAVTYKRAWRRGPEDPAIKRVTQILSEAADEIDQVWQKSDGADRESASKSEDHI
ncbi:MAG: PadR family transcriptional regulator [Candidatus Acidiferrales bacterium]